MISVKKYFNDIPASLRDKKNRTGREEKCNFKDDVREKLRRIYNKKCAYCESNDYLEIEHYRPRRRVTGEPDHEGYYWLAYEWSNLLYVCKPCNSGKGAKGTKFPLETGGKRVFSPQDAPSQWVSDSRTFRDEKPLLLNPEIDKPEDHLEFLYNGSVQEKNGSIRGKGTIEICNLKRDHLSLAQRKKKIDDILRDIKEQTLELKKRSFGQTAVDKKYYSLSYKTIFNKIKKRMSPENEFSRVYFYLYENFDEFLERNCETKNIKDSWKRIIKEAFAMFKQGKL